MIIWLINPWLGVITSFAFMVKIGEKKNQDLLTALLILFTIILFQLSLPMPLDLESTKRIYFDCTVDPFRSALSISYISRDTLSYGVLNLLAWGLPSFPISFYLLNIIIGFYCLWFIYKKQNSNIKLDNLILFSGIFLIVLDYQETHHFLRQTTALLMLISAFYIFGIKKYILVLCSMLWHGSTILFIPALIINYLFKDKNKMMILCICLFFLFWYLSNINIYQLLASKHFTDREFIDFNIGDRFLTYFRHTRNAKYFSIYREMGNPQAMYYIFLGLTISAYSFIKKRFKNPILRPTTMITLWIVFFRYHSLIYDRLQYGFIILILLFWTIELSSQQFKNKKIFGTCFIALCFLKIIFFNWPLDLTLEGRNIYSYSSVELVLRIKDWPINQ